MPVLRGPDEEVDREAARGPQSNGLRDITGRYVYRPFLDCYKRRPALGEQGSGVAKQPESRSAQEQESPGCEHEDSAQPSAAK